MSGSGQPVGNILAGVVELLATHEIHRRGGLQRAVGIDHGLGADQADQDAGIRFFQQLGEARISRERRRAGVDDDEVVTACDLEALCDGQLVGRRIENTRTRHQGRRLREPRGIPEGFDLTLGLVARAGTSVETIE